MKTTWRWVSVACVGALASVAMGALLPTVEAPSASAAPVPQAVRVAETHPGSGRVQHPLWLRVHGQGIAGSPLVTSSATPIGFTPSSIKSYLGLGGTGTGQTIAIVAAYDDPNIAADLAKFDTTFGLPAPPSFKKVSQTGTTKYPPADSGWALEIALDVEWAHALAPAANILLVEATSNTFSNMDTAIAYAAKQTGVTVISNSWGSTEFNGEATTDSYCKLTTAVCVFSTGDTGNPGSYPAYSPYVVSVGGTSLQLATDGTGNVVSEVAWSGSGGGSSLYEAKPAYQNLTNPTTHRGTPDVSFNGDPATGVAVYDSVLYNGQSGWFQMGGTSAGAPQWAAIIAVADQLRKAAGKTPLVAWKSTTSVYNTNVDLYGLSSGLADITTGATNGTCGTLCAAGPGYDFVTGLGSPRKGIDAALKAAA